MTADHHPPVRNELAGQPAWFIKLGIALLEKPYRTATGTVTFPDDTITLRPMESAHDYILPR